MEFKIFNHELFLNRLLPFNSQSLVLESIIMLDSLLLTYFYIVISERNDYFFREKLLLKANLPLRILQHDKHWAPWATVYESSNTFKLNIYFFIYFRQVVICQHQRPLQRHFQQKENFLRVSYLLSTRRNDCSEKESSNSESNV